MYINILLIALVILFIIIIFIEFNKQINTSTYESFQDQPNTSSAPETLEKELEKKYKTFLDFYIKFCVSWNKAIVTLSVSNTPQQPLKSPSDVSTLGNAPEPSNEDLMLNIRLLEKQLGVPLPSTCVDFPQTITKENIDSIISIFPSDSTPYINALSWMNKHMSDAHANLNKALTTNPLEGFQSSEPIDCKNVEKCTKENEAQKTTQKQQELLQLINNFFSNKEQLSQLMGENTKLVEKSNKIQQQAQSGELYKQINVKDNTYYSTPTMPEGGDNLKKLQNTNPQKYNELKQNYSQWFNIKSMIEQINSNLT